MFYESGSAGSAAALFQQNRIQEEQQRINDNLVLMALIPMVN